ncbi:hypothetical protein [Streptomyces sp. NPDC047000]|uniref:hypothetical protein n=1 Tax=Streptomyces sp. NPDC047000 TaxID=3155474 RepID=UPI0033E6CF98
MVSSSHEATHRIFQERPEILTPVFKLLNVELPEKPEVEVITSDVTELRPLARYVDTALRVKPADGDDFLLVVETQSARSQKKEISWPYYVAYLQSKHGLPVLLVVLCKERATAKWAAGPFDCTARGWTAQRTYPLVLGPGNVPVIADERTVVDQPALAAFSALIHADGPASEAILEAACRGFARLDPTDELFFFQFVEAGLGDTPAGVKWRQIMEFVNYFPGRGTLLERTYCNGKANGKAEGRAEGKAEGILRVLEVRGLDVSDDVRERVTGCTDLDRLSDWLDRAVIVAEAEELFAEPEAEPDPDEQPES